MYLVIVYALLCDSLFQSNNYGHIISTKKPSLEAAPTILF